MYYNLSRMGACFARNGGFVEIVQSNKFPNEIFFAFKVNIFSKKYIQIPKNMIK
jgi:hypothetical protein